MSAGDARARQRLASEDALARRIAIERKRRGWSQETLAAKVEKILGGGFPQSAISKIEKPTGRRAITVNEALALSEVLGIPLLDLVLPPEIAASKTLERLFTQAVRAKDDVERALEVQASVHARIWQELNDNPALLGEFHRQASSGAFSDAFAMFLEVEGIQAAPRQQPPTGATAWTELFEEWGFTERARGGESDG